MTFWINAAIWAIIIGIGMWKSKLKPLTAAFIVSLYVRLEAYFYVSKPLALIFANRFTYFIYAIPVCIFLASSFIYCKKVKIKWEDVVEEMEQERFYRR